MDQIVERLMENHRLVEMAYERSDAIDRCASLGDQFISHFRKILLSGGMRDPDFDHHCKEMQTWYDSIRKIVLKSSKKALSNDQLINWFFTAGSSVEIIFSEDKDFADLYDKFMIQLLVLGDVKAALEEVFNGSDSKEIN